MKCLKMMLTAALVALTGALFADVMLEEEVPVLTAEVKAIPTIVTQAPAQAVQTTYEEKVVEFIDPSTKTYPVCNECKNKIPHGRHYIMMKDGRTFCSQTCFRAALPKCEVCGTRFMSGLIKDNHFICSQTCLAATWPKCQCCGVRSMVWKVLPENNEIYCPTCLTYKRCHSCLRPDRFAKDLKDGRYLCRTCQKTAILDTADAVQLITEVRDLMHNKLNIPIDTNGIGFTLCTPKELRKNAQYRYPGQEPGTLVRREKTTEKTVTEKKPDGTIEQVKKPVTELTYDILILDSLSKAKFTETAAHELAALWLETNYPNIGDYAIKEGFGEWVAAQINTLYGRGEMNIRMEANPDPYYGEGYRRVKKMIEQNGFGHFKTFLEALANPERP